MITVAQAREMYPPGQAPPEKELEQILAAFYGIASREWDEMLEEQVHDRD